MFLQTNAYDKKRKLLGKRGEAAVVQYLQQQGFLILAQNVHTRWGEIDILARRRGHLHVIEVKTRISSTYGDPAAAITRTKFLKVRKSMLELRQRSLGFTGPWQIDAAVVELRRTDASTARITMYWNIGLDDIQ